MKRWIGILTMMALGAATGALAAAPMEGQFIWDEANARMATARTEKDFLLAAQTYARLVNTGVRNGPVFYNLGTALLKARQYDPALGIFLRAERYLGSNPEIRRNLLLALAGDDKDAELSLPWYRFFLFWHYGLSAAARLTIAVVAWAVFWAGLILRVLGAPRLARPLVLGGILAVALFGSSVAASLYQEVNERAVRINPDATLTAPARPAKSPGKTVTNVRSETRK
jgi:tetratricopeptide (TPR) repeat protein